MTQSEIEKALLDGLLQGVKDHVAKIANTIMDDPGQASSQMVSRFRNGLIWTRTFYDLALNEIKKEFGELQ